MNDCGGYKINAAYYSSNSLYYYMTMYDSYANSRCTM